MTAYLGGREEKLREFIEAIGNIQVSGSGVVKNLL
jgi:hypothetical protein